MRCGIVGLPNVGKSSLFNALTNSSVASENFPFCTIDPHLAIVPIPDDKLHALATIAASKKIIPASMEFTDIAGLVKGASQGEGLGNEFLSHIREADVLVHVVRCFEDKDVTHVMGRVNALDDIEIITTELLLADLNRVTSASQKTAKSNKSNKQESQADQASRKELLSRLVEHLDQGKPAATFTYAHLNAGAWLAELNLLTSKKILYVANVGDDELDGNEQSAQVAEYAKGNGSDMLVICSKLEAEIAQLGDEDRAEFLNELRLECSGLDRVIQKGYELLGYKTFYTVGPKEARAWAYTEGTMAPQAAGKIHTDFEKGFIRAEVISYEDYIADKGEQGAKQAGNWRLEGKNYVMQDGDVVHFRFAN